MKKKTIARIILGLAIVLIVGLYILNPQVNSKINYIFMLFSSMSVESIIGYIRSFGPYAVCSIILFNGVSVCCSPASGIFNYLCQCNNLGWWRGAILSWSSAMAGAILCFMIARIAGRDVVEKLTTSLRWTVSSNILRDTGNIRF
mgnify:CR=1 FL=1